MIDPNFILLYVESPTNSVAFYTKLLGKEPIDASPTFAMYDLDSGVKLGLWARHTVTPKVVSAPGSFELAFCVADRSVVNDTHAEWAEKGLTIAQVPGQMDFGYTFTALDPDGHRLRVFAPE
ncbi:VOC family protein [Oxalobacteraceae bacterium]|nr:VOC family protein [Oxalobacteraceae bacterium]